MNMFRLICRALAHHRRIHLGLAAGAAVTTAVLVGALIVGDSVSHSLEQMAVRRLGRTQLAMFTTDRFFSDRLAGQLNTVMGTKTHPSATALMLEGVAITDGGKRRTPEVRVLGIDPTFWQVGGAEPQGPQAEDGVVINRRLADALDVREGDGLMIRFAKPSALPRDVPLGSEVEETVTLRGNIERVVDANAFGDFDLSANQIPPFNVFVHRKKLQQRAGIDQQNNLVLVSNPQTSVPEADRLLKNQWRLEDAGLRLRRIGQKGPWDLSTRRVFLDESVAKAAHRAAPARSVLTYLVNALESEHQKITRYATVSAYDPSPIDHAPNTPLAAQTNAHQAAITQWLADELALKTGDRLTMRYWVFGLNRKLTEQTAHFTVDRIVPTEGPGGDRWLMPEFPGMSDVDSALDWEPPADLNIKTELISPSEETYWDEHRGAPKAFVHLDWAQQKNRWTTPYGQLTALRFGAHHEEVALRQSIRNQINPATLGLTFRSIRATAIRASREGAASYFGYLFIGLSLFVIVSAITLTLLLFAFNMQQRCGEMGLLLSVGWPHRRVRRMLVLEGLIVASVGSLIGMPLGWLYASTVLKALSSQWSGAVADAAIAFHAKPATPWIGFFTTLLMAWVTMLWVLRQQMRRPAKALLLARFGLSHASGWQRRTTTRLAIATMAMAIGSVAMAAYVPGMTVGGFFLSGSLVLVGVLLALASGMKPSDRSMSGGLGFHRMAWQNSSRRRGRSLATVGMLASGTFLVVAVNAFRLNDANTTGTGDFGMFARTAIPVAHDLNTASGIEHFGLEDLKETRFLAMRLRGGDEASCRNLNRPQEAPLLGVDPETIDARSPFRFTATLASDTQPTAHPWRLLRESEKDQHDHIIPGVVDQAVAQWVLKVGLGDSLHYVDDRGQPFEIKIVGMLSNSILQGYVLIDQQAFADRFPSIGGSRVFLIDTPASAYAQNDRLIKESRLQDHGITTMRASDRLAAFNAVQNTYLSIFTAMGGLGLILGCVGLGLVVLRNVLERRSELGLMRAMGYSPGRLRKMILFEHGSLMLLGTATGVLASMLAVAPALRRESELPYQALAITCFVIVLSGLFWIVLATAAAIRGRLLQALRHE